MPESNNEPYDFLSIIQKTLPGRKIVKRETSNTAGCRSGIITDVVIRNDLYYAVVLWDTDDFISLDSFGKCFFDHDDGTSVISLNDLYDTNIFQIFK